MNKKIILFDIDYTMFDTAKFKKLIADVLTKHVRSVTPAFIDEVYLEVRNHGNFDPRLFAKIFTNKHAVEVAEEEIERIWYDTEVIQQALYPEVFETLKQLQSRKDIILGIFSAGQTAFQQQKISSLADFFDKERIHISEFKEETLVELMHAYRNETVVLIDDLITILQKAKLLKPDLFAIWMKRGRFALNAEMPTGFEPDVTVTNLTEVVDMV